MSVAPADRGSPAVSSGVSPAVVRRKAATARIWRQALAIRIDGDGDISSLIAWYLA